MKPTKISRRRKNSRLEKPGNQIRIIAGSMRGRKIHFSDGEGLRPTLDRVRETLFNWVAPEIHGSYCLDLFAGSGALGFEAISRGAEFVKFVELNKIAASNIQNNLTLLELDNASVDQCSADDFLNNNNQLYDLVFLDPPYEKGHLQTIIEKIRPILAKDGLLYVEQENSNSNFVFPQNWNVLKSKSTGRFKFELATIRNG